MRWLLVAIAFSLAIVSFIAAAQAPDYELVPWPYGVVAWVQTPPENAQQIIDHATHEVNAVFSFWGLPSPEAAPDWQTPRLVDTQSWLRDWVRNIQDMDVLLSPTQSPRDYFLETGIPVIMPSQDEMWVMSPLTWDTQPIFPLKLIVFPDRETMDAAFSDYSFRAFFLPVSRSSLEDPAIDIDWYLFWSPTDSVVFSTKNDSELALLHGLSCWVFHLWCEEHEIDMAGIPRLIIEGFASYCAHSLIGDDPWRVIAAQWAAEGSLSDVPPSLLHEVGASFIDILVKQEGNDGLLQLLADPATDWEKIETKFEDQWKASLFSVQVTTANRAWYEAKKERLQLCVELLSPILPDAARSIADRLYNRKGTMNDIKRFWQLVSIPVLPPSDECWTDLLQRSLTFTLVQMRDANPQTETLARRLLMKLGTYAIRGDWKAFISWYMRGIREIISRYGELPYHWRSMRTYQYWFNRAGS